MIARLGLFLLLAAALLTGRTTVSASQRQTPPARSVVVVSDLHMGEGREPSGEWNAYEDFRWADEFAAFLNASDREGQSAVDLILNGDTFELLQSTHGDCTGPTDSVGCSEAEASQRLERVLAAHATELKALAQFARQGANRVVFVAGDHDAALLFARLGRRVVSALAVPGNRVEVAQKGYWLSPDGLVYAEHGHQIGNDAHRFEGWPAPFVAAAGGQRLQRPWGEAVAQRIHNQYEPRFPIIDSMAVLGTGIKYALSEAGAELKAIPSLVRYLLFASSWQQFRMELDDGDVRAPTWDIAQVRAQGASFLISSIPDDDPFKPTVAQAAAATGLASVLERLTDSEVVALCDYRAAVRRARRRFEPLVTQFAPRGPAVSECPRTPESRGALFDYFWRSRDERFLGHLDKIAAGLPGQKRPAVFVYGHTHLPDRSQSTANMISGGLLKIPMEGFSPVRGALTPVVINDGAWQRTLTPVQLARMASERGVSDQQAFATLRHEDLPPCYSFVTVGIVNGEAMPAVRYWRRSPQGEWGAAAGCGR
ncbi:MAG: hypothetical protein DMF89_20195 [Acidobacteria bacterium]|nr:MAG: hypothetical protein DMF90_12110 [Acidobacteriota bacterium]PYR46930.1 MAG: hypothetical protein DMF89_20195 [Acidobacteriota bacterium]